MKTKYGEKKNRSVGKRIGIIILILSLFGDIASAIPIDKKETLGPYDGGHKYYIHIYNVDDVAKAIVKGNQIAQINYQQDSGWIEITGYLTEGSNTIEFTDENAQGQPTYRYWTYGFELRQDDSNIIWKDSCGTVGNPSTGCMNNDITTGLVDRNIITLIIESKHELSDIYPTVISEQSDWRSILVILLLVGLIAIVFNSKNTNWQNNIWLYFVVAVIAGIVIAIFNKLWELS